MTTTATCIDGHAHVVPQSFLEEVERSARAFGVEVERTPEGHAITFPGLPRLRAAGGRLVDLEARTAWMDDEQVAVQMAGAWLDVAGYALPPDREVEWVRLLNEHLAAQTASAGQRFRALASVPLQNGNAAALELEYAVNKLGVSGAMLPSDPMDIDLAAPEMEPFWEAAASLDVPVLLHGASHSKWRHFGPAYLGFSLGRTLDTTVLASKLLLGGLLDRHPALRLVLCHGGGALPYLIGRIEDGYQRGTDKTASLQRNGPADYLADLYYDTVTLNARSARLLLDTAGADHVMLGSDYVWGPMAGDFSKAAQAATGDETEWASVRSGTAQALFGLSAERVSPS
ncbi:MAG: amidohydrolase family protein [Dehalococcoidia bacterium]